MAKAKITISNLVNMSKKIAVIGSGAWGLGLASLIASNKNLVHIFSRDVFEAAKANKILIKNKVSAIADANFSSTVKGAEFIFVVVPSDATSIIFKSLSKEKISPKTIIVVCSKGIDGKTLKLFSDSAKEILPQNNYAILSGPNFAGEIADGLPATTTIASPDKKTAQNIVKVLENDHFKPIISDDVVAAQIFGAIKNVFAIGCGIIEGLKIGENAKAALVLKGALEAAVLIEKLGGKPHEHFISPAGLGDLFLTCSSRKSRNNSLGFMIGSGKKVKEILASKTTFEGFSASELIIKFAKKYKVKLPLCETINQILQGNFSTKEIKKIISKAILDY